jgi:LuxR family transcriptional regulator, maltose regulon positive regulatory protein
MVITLQKTKLFIPPERAQLVGRPRLISRLDSLLAEGCREALISAPDGSGKTTRVVQWLGDQGIRAGWLSLDARDNVPTRFFAYLIAALRAIASDEGISSTIIGREALSLLDLPSAYPEEIITLLTNDLADAPGPLLDCQKH